MDKYEYNIKAEQILKLIDKKDFSTAAKIADGIDWKRVRNVNMLTNVGSVYAETGRYEDAKEIYLLAYDRAPISRRLAYKLTEVSILAEDYSEAEHYYDIFVDLAPRDSRKYELQYKMAKKKGEPVEKLIEILKEYKKNDFEDVWAYELARLYHKAGMGEACVSECDEIILWFGEGPYVEKAMELKMLYTPLSLSQQEKYNKRYQPQMKYSTEAVMPETVQEVPPMQVVQPTQAMQTTQELQEMQEQMFAQQPVYQPEMAAESEEPEEIPEQAPQQPVSVSTDIYNTANIQAVLAESMKELMKEEEEKKAAQNMAATKDLRDIRRVLEWNNVTYPEPQEEPFRVVADQQPTPEMVSQPVQMAESMAQPEYQEMQATQSAYQEIQPTQSVQMVQEQAVAQQPVYQPEEPSEQQMFASSEITEEDVQKVVMHTAQLKAEIDKVIEELESEPSAEQSSMLQQEPTQAGKLSDELRQTFAAFLHINGLEEKLAEIFEEAEKIGEERETSLFGNILVIGDHKSGKTTLATEVMKSLSRATNRKNRKIAKISGDRLNNKGMKETIARLNGADLLIERAGEMNHTTAQELLKAMEGNTGGMVVVLEDTQEGMTHLLAENPEVEVRFTHKLILKEYEISEWVQLAKQYAQELDYGVDEMATLALSAKIDALYAQKTVIELDDVKDIIDAAIEHSERKNIKKLFETVFSRKYKDSDLTMLRENDFV